MKKNIFGRQLKRDINERKALFKNLMTSLVLHDRIQTTEPKAKAVKASVEKLVTKAKKKGANATSDLLPYLHRDAVKKIINDIAPRFSKRNGGYTRIMKLGRRFGDDASTVIMEWVESSLMPEAKDKKTTKKSQKAALESSGSVDVKKTKQPAASKKPKLKSETKRDDKKGNTAKNTKKTVAKGKK